MQFWLDCWCGSSSLADRYPDFFRICRNKEASVADLMRFTNGVLHWEILFCRDVHNQELEAFQSFINSIYCTPVRRFGEDKRCWLPCWCGFLCLDRFCHAPNPIPRFVTMTGMLISSLNLILTRTNLAFNKTFTEAFLFL